MRLNDAIHTLRLPYTFTITAEGKTAEARKQLCSMTVDITEKIRDELLRAGIRQYIMSLGYTWTDTEAILNGPRERSTINLGK